METIVTALSKYMHGLSYNDLPENVREIAKTRILDCLSCAIAGQSLPPSLVALKAFKNSSGNATVFGYQPKVSLLEATLVNAVLTSSICQGDQMGGSGSIHASTVIVPAALTVGGQEKSSGTDALLSIVLGYELAGRLSIAVGPFSKKAFRRGMILATFGAAAAAGKLFRLNEAQLTNCIGYAASLAPATLNATYWSDAMEPNFHAGASAHIGVLAAVLAASGATAPAQALEGRDGFFSGWAESTKNIKAATENLGENFIISDTTIKPLPVCGLNLMPIQTALPLANCAFKVADIDKVVERISPILPAGSDFAGPFSSQLQAQMSMQFCAAATILGRPVTSLAFYVEHYDDPEVGELAKKVELVPEKDRIMPRVEVYL
jgi:2-methylcitrate dehydratase PrpD